MEKLTDLEIANKALAKLGLRAVSSLEEAEESARVAKALYGTVRDYELSVYRWAFALKRAALAKDADKPAFGFKNQYSLPADFLRLEEVDGLRGERDAYAVEGNKILTDLPAPLQIIYLSRELNTVKWPPYFVEAFSCRLAYEMCERLKQDPSRKTLLMQEYQLVIQAAKRSNAIQMAVMAAEPTPWEVAHGI